MSDASVNTGSMKGGGEPRHSFLGRLYADYADDLRRYIHAKFGVGPPEPDDVAHAAFMRLAALKNPETVENPQAYLYATARNIVVDHHRRQTTSDAFAKEQAGQAHDDALYELSPERVLLSRERYSKLIEALCALPARHRRAIILSRLHGLKYAEIGARLAMSPGGVRKLIERGLAKCAAELDVMDLDLSGDKDD